MLRRSFLLSSLCLPSLCLAADEPDLTPVKRWIERSAKLTTVQGTFSQAKHMRSLKKPLESTGAFWATMNGSIRWQAGDPPKVIAVRKAGGDLFIAQTDKKKAQQHSKASLEKEGAGPALALLEAGFPRSLAEFEKRFRVLSVTPQPGDFDAVEVALAGDAGTFAIRKVVLRIYRPTAVLGGMEVHLRDGSWIASTFTKIEENPAIPDAQFQIDLAGYEIEKP